MATTNGNRKILDLKRWEFCTPAPAATVAGAFVASSRHYRQQQLYVVSATVQYLYSPLEDAWVQIPSGALAGTFAVGACGTATSVGPSGTATAGTTSTITTGLTLARDLRGYSIHITGGPNAGVTLPILSNTIGATAIITVAAQASAFTSSTTFRLLTPRWYVLNAITAAGTTTAAVFRFYDFALNTWSSAETGATDGIAPAAVIGTDSKLIATPSWMGDGYAPFATLTATAALASAAAPRTGTLFRKRVRAVTVARRRRAILLASWRPPVPPALAASGAVSVTASASLSVAKPLSAAATIAITGAAALTVAKPLSAGATVTVTGAADLGIPGSGAALGAVAAIGVTASANLTVAKPLAASALVTVTAVGSLASVVDLAAVAGFSITATATITGAVVVTPLRGVVTWRSDAAPFVAYNPRATPVVAWDPAAAPATVWTSTLKRRYGRPDN